MIAVGSIWIFSRRLRLQHVREEMMVAVPLASIIQRDDEQVSPFQTLEQCLRARFADDGVAERAAQSVEYRGA